MEVSLHNISKSFKQKDNSTLNVFSEINLTVNNGQLISLIGPSGCGKSTLLNIIAGIEVQDKGDIYIDKSLEANRLGVCGYLQQKDLLLPWRNILDNVILGSELKGEKKKESLYKAKKYLDRFGLKGFEYEYPHNLSGGMRQRASFLRTLLADQKLFLLDEPFSALDSLNRSKMQDWLLNIKKELDKTIILVTHDIDEAILLSDKIYVMSNIPAQIILTENINYPRVNTTTMLSDNNYFKTKKNIMDALSSLEN
ncbi:MAG: hypothetical protein CL758_03445 [Chloroflexi bacterium]|nr:hypothetical protein [Chloroflexota bacterium]|tara:strand:+ start:201 stop:962 length:762 start_codon:yes stop_codon:yes gene_type:complete